MKDIMARLTKAEKDLITNIREYDVFTFKDIINDIEHLTSLAKITEKTITTEHIHDFLISLYPILNEREAEARRKLSPRKNTNKPEVIERVKESPIDNKNIKKLDLTNKNRDIIDKFKNRNYRTFIR
jgi:hypothetical protein